MASAIATTSAGTRMERYRASERELWDHYGLEPSERILDLDSSAVRLRVLEVGSGDPVLFVHGTVGPGGWPSLIHELPGYRSIVLELPGWGLSSPIEFTGQEYKTLVASVLRGALDALELERAHVVGGSIGNVWALRLAAEHPSRIDRIALLGGGPIVSQAGVPGIIRLLASLAGALMVRLPDKPARVRSILRQIGARSESRCRAHPGRVRRLARGRRPRDPLDAARTRNGLHSRQREVVPARADLRGR